MDAGVLLNPLQVGGSRYESPVFSGSPQAEVGGAVKVPSALVLKGFRTEAEASFSDLDREKLRKVLDKTVDLVRSLGADRHLKYEVIESAGLVQIQVIDSRDGTVIRKIPADEIVKLLENIHETLTDRLDVRA
ncbi:MAG: flagellar protein FlaG [Fretibacterium sp.]|nr:flagellar protein FlaG [Fretibacterium sp.]